MGDGRHHPRGLRERSLRPAALWGVSTPSGGRSLASPSGGHRLRHGRPRSSGPRDQGGRPRRTPTGGTPRQRSGGRACHIHARGAARGDGGRLRAGLPRGPGAAGRGSSTRWVEGDSGRHHGGGHPDAPHTVRLGRAHLHAHLGPAICGACYEVGPEVCDALGLPKQSGPTPVDVRALLVSRARSLGMQECRITVSEHCTLCGTAGLFSHRGGRSERQAALLGIRP